MIFKAYFKIKGWNRICIPPIINTKETREIKKVFLKNGGIRPNSFQYRKIKSPTIIDPGTKITRLIINFAINDSSIIILLYLILSLFRSFLNSLNIPYYEKKLTIFYCKRIRLCIWSLLQKGVFTNKRGARCSTKVIPWTWR